MRYEDVRDGFRDELQEAGLLNIDLDSGTETIDLSTTERQWRICIGPP